MIKVDISHVWGQLALPDLLAMEKEVAQAHATLVDGLAESAHPGAYRGNSAHPERCPADPQ